MGMMDWLIKARRDSDPLAGMDLGTTSPWKPAGALAPIIAGDLIPEFPQDRFPLTRADAMTIPGVAKLRNLLISTISPLPLVAMDKLSTERLANQPTFLYRTNALQSPEDRTAATVDDLLFFGASLWIVERGAGDSPKGGPILSAAWVPFSEWQFEVDANTRQPVMKVYDTPLADSAYILFNVPLYDGLLALASRTMRGAKAVEESWVARAKNPIPLLALKLDNEVELEPDEIDAIAASWTVRKNNTTSTVGVLPKGVTLEAIGQSVTDLLEGARNAMRGDIGAFANVNAAMLDGTSGVNSLTYTTKDGERSIFLTEAVPMWITPIQSRLSMDDVVPSGQRVRFDMSELINVPSPTGAPTED